MEHCKYLEDQYLNEKTADIYFVTENSERIPAHKAILAANSLMLEEHFNKNIGVKTIEIPSASPSAFKEFLFTFYSKYPEKKFTVENAFTLLKLAKTFDMAFCIHTYEQFLMKNLTSETLCSGFNIAKHFGLADLELHCQKQINLKKGEVFSSKGFLYSDLNIIQEILTFITVSRRNEIEIVWNACMKWAEVQCVKSSIDPSDLKNRRQILGECFDTVCYIAMQDSDFMTFAMKHFEGLFNENELNYTSTIDETAVLQHQDNQNDIETMVFERFRETMLATQICGTNDSISVELHTTKRITLNGIAFSTVTGVPKGRISIRAGNNESIWFQQQISISSKQREHKNFCRMENVILEPHQTYIIDVELSKNVIAYRSRTVSNLYKGKDFEVSLLSRSRRDILSHFFFST